GSPRSSASSSASPRSGAATPPSKPSARTCGRTRIPPAATGSTARSSTCPSSSRPSSARPGPRWRRRSAAGPGDGGPAGDPPPVPASGSGSVSRGLPLGEGPKSYAPRAWAPRPKGGRGRLTHYPASPPVAVAPREEGGEHLDAVPKVLQAQVLVRGVLAVVVVDGRNDDHRHLHDAGEEV